MPWTRQQVKYLMSKGSPLTEEERKKMEAELHANPSMGHKRKGSKGMKRHHSANDGSFIDNRRNL